MRAFVVFVHEVYHQWCAHQWDAYPQPGAPVLAPKHKYRELNEVDESCRVSPDKKHVLARGYPFSRHLGTNLGDDVKFIALVHNLLPGILPTVVRGFVILKLSSVETFGCYAAGKHLVRFSIQHLQSGLHIFLHYHSFVRFYGYLSYNDFSTLYNIHTL